MVLMVLFLYVYVKVYVPLPRSPFRGDSGGGVGSGIE
jgi:hypothetical protein